MNNLNWLELIPYSEAIGWTLLHSIWQIGLIAIVLRLVLFLIPKQHPNIRYSLLLLSLMFSVIWVGKTFEQERLLMDRLSESSTIHSTSKNNTQELSRAAIFEEDLTIITRPIEETTPASSITIDAILNKVAPYVPMLTIGWLIGVFLLSILMLFGFVHLQRLRSQHIIEVEKEWANVFIQLKQQMGIFRKVQFTISEKIKEPVTFHFFKPVVLVPVSFFSGLSTEQVEVILLHELAHIRRHDYLVNTIQSMVEILFFYHPAIWWMSGKIREEREHCCDDLVLKVRNNPIVYAEALTRLQVINHSKTTRLAMSLNGKGSAFKKRIFRLFGQEEQPRTFLKSGLVGILLLFAFFTQAFMQSDIPINKITTSPSTEQILEEENLDQNPTSTQPTVLEEKEANLKNEPKITPSQDLVVQQNHPSPSNDFEQLMQAIRDNDYETVKELLAKGIDIHQHDENGITPLLLAVQSQHKGIMNLLLDATVEEAGFDFNFSQKDAICHELTEAVRLEDTEKVIALLKIVDPNCIDPNPGYDTYMKEGNHWKTLRARTPLVAAARKGNLDITKLLIAKGADINFQDAREETPLMAAAEYGTLEMVEYLLSKGANLEEFSRGEGTVLSVAARGGNLEIVKYFVSKGFDLDAKTRGEGTPLSVAARSGHLEVVKYLLSKGADINAQTYGEGTPLSVAARSGYLEVVQFLIEKGADINSETRGEGTPLSVAARSGHTEVVQYLLEKGAEMDANSTGEGTPLSVAARSGHLETVKLLIERGADINAQTYGEGTPLSVAARSGHAEVVTYLLSKGADINADTRGEGTPLTVAARSGHLYIVRILLENGADINAYSRGEGTPIAVAARSGHPGIVDYLLAHGAEATIDTPKEGTTITTSSGSRYSRIKESLFGNRKNDTSGESAPISIAARSGHIDVVKMLLEKGADIYANSRGEGTPLSLAARSGHRDMVEYLLQQGADRYSHTRGEGTPLSLATRSGHLQLVKFFVEKGIDIESKTKGEGTPLSLAARSGHLEIVKYLLASGADIHSNTKGEGTPLSLAIRSNHPHIVQYLTELENGKK